MHTNKAMSAKFWGVRGSIASPTPGEIIRAKIVHALRVASGDPNFLKFANSGEIDTWLDHNIPFPQRSTYGGNTTCVEVRCGEHLIILDMGTGLRRLGNALMQETIKNHGLRGTILQSHVHWDHVQGYPFWPQLYMPRGRFKNSFMFYGGRNWDKSLEEVLRNQMDPPSFPVNHREIEQVGLKMYFETVYDGREITPQDCSDIQIVTRKLNHPQETYGYRITYAGKTIVFCTDHEPYAALHRPLVELAQDADIFITDCQYTRHEYLGEGGKVQKLGWGHSFPEAIAEAAQAARVKRIITTHHDPDASDEHIEEIAASVEKLSGIPTVAAHEGLALHL